MLARWLFRLTLLAILTWSAGIGHAQTSPIPDLSQWQTQMLTYGQQHCTNLAKNKNGPIDSAVGATYYDLTRVMHQIAAYTGDASWLACADLATYEHRDRYVIPNKGAVPGYWNFTTGLRMDWQRTLNPLSQQAVTMLSTTAAYTSDYTDLSWVASFGKVREVAYAVLSYIEAEAVGAPRRARRAQYVDLLHDHLKQMQDPTKWGTDQVSPFMMGLAAEALTADWEQTQDPRLVPALSAAANFFWILGWDASSRSMYYQINPLDSADGGAQFNPAPDLNLLIAPVYAWLYMQTGDPTQRDRADALFAGGVSSAWLQGTKQYNQNYRWSFDYVKWRSSPPAGAGSALPTGVLGVTITSPEPFATLGGTSAFVVAVTGAQGPVSIAPKVDLSTLPASTHGDNGSVLTLDTTKLSDSGHLLSVVVTDAAGKTGTASINFFVHNR